MPGIGFIQPPLASIEVHFGATRMRLLMFVTQDALSGFARQLSDDDKSLFVEVRSVHGHIYMVRRAAMTRVVTELQASPDNFAQILQPPAASQVVLHFADGTSAPFTADAPFTVVQYMVDLAAARSPDTFCAITGAAARLLTLPVRELDIMVASKASIDAALAARDAKSSPEPMRRFLMAFDAPSHVDPPADPDTPLPGERRPARTKPPRKLS